MRAKTEPEYVYMMVTSDEYELPICVATSAKQLAEMVGVDEGTIWRQTWMVEHGRMKRSKYIRVALEGDEDEV